MHDVTIIDYGLGNLLSVSRAVEHCGSKVIVTADPDIIISSTKVILPGVGSFSHGMAELHHQNIDTVVKELATRGTPLMGICLGMQMLLDESEEFGVTKGLGLIHGRVIPIPTITATGQSQKIPHIGWNTLILPKHRKNWNGTLLHDVRAGEEVYFVHSFMASPTDSDHRIADCLYGDVPVSAVIGRENIFGCQFHPEKSGEVGLKVLQTFLKL
jgi:glutamine amidotransferase